MKAIKHWQWHSKFLSGLTFWERFQGSFISKQLYVWHHNIASNMRKVLLCTYGALFATAAIVVSAVECEARDYSTPVQSQATWDSPAQDRV